MSIRSEERKYRSTAHASVLCLLFAAVMLCSCVTVKISREMTVAAIREKNPGDHFTRVTFSESQRFYKLPDDADPAYMQLLQESQKNNTPVVVSTDKKHDDVIVGVKRKK